MINEATIITASNGAKLTLDTLKEAIEDASVNWTMAAFAFEKNAPTTPLDICLNDFFNIEKWHEVDGLFLDAVYFWKQIDPQNDIDICSVLALVIERRAEIEWTYLAKKRGWDNLMHPSHFKEYGRLNPFEAAIYHSAPKNGFKVRQKEKNKDGKTRKYWAVSTLYGGKTFQVVVTFADIDKDVLDMTYTAWTRDDVFVNIEEGKKLKFGKIFRTSIGH